MLIKIISQKTHANPGSLYDEVANILLDINGDQGVLFINEGDIALIYSSDEKRIIGCIKFLQDIKISTPDGIRGIKNRTMVLYKWFGWKSNKVVVYGVGTKELYKDLLMGLIGFDLYKYTFKNTVEFEDDEEVGLFLNVLNFLSIDFKSNFTVDLFKTHNMGLVELKHPRTFVIDFDMLSDNNRGFKRVGCDALVWNLLNFVDLKSYVDNIDDSIIKKDLANIIP